MQDWFIISENFGNLSLALKRRDTCSIERLLVEIISILLKIAEENCISMEDAWEKWRTKALSKKYD